MVVEAYRMFRHEFAAIQQAKADMVCAELLLGEQMEKDQDKVSRFSF